MEFEATIFEREHASCKTVEKQETKGGIAGESDSTSEKDPTFWENFTRKDLKHFRKYVNTTATHGVRRIFVGRSKIRRLLWLLLFLVALGICLNNCIRQILLLSEWPTRLTVVERRQDSLPFPAVTVCNINPLRKSKIDQLNITDFLDCSFEVYAFTGSMLSESADHIRSCKKNHTYGREELLNYTILEVFKNASQDPSRFIVDCGWYGSDIPSNCNYKNFTGVPTNAGYCYTFNGGDHPLHVGGPGQRFSFDMTLNIEREEYAIGTQTAGVFVTIHNQSEPPQPFQSGLAVPPGSHAFIKLDYEIHKFLGPPYGNCQDISDADKLNFFSMYNVPTCQQNNLFTRVAEVCRCIDPVAPTPLRKYLDYPSCTMDDLPCVLQQFVDTTHSSKDDDCSESCSKVLFPSHLSFGSFPTKATETKLRSTYNASDGMPYTAEEIQGNFLHVSIFYGSLVEIDLKQETAYDGVLLIADMGGQLGFFLGVSIISLSEFFVWIFDELKDRLLWCKVVRRKLEKPKNVYTVNPVNDIIVENEEVAIGKIQTE